MSDLDEKRAEQLRERILSGDGAANLRLNLKLAIQAYDEAFSMLEGSNSFDRLRYGAAALVIALDDMLRQAKIMCSDVRNALSPVMQRGDVFEIDGRRIGLAANPSRLAVNQALLPQEWLKMVPDMDKISHANKNGISIDGVTVEPGVGFHISIRKVS